MSASADMVEEAAAPRPVRRMARTGEVRTASRAPPWSGVTARISGPWLGVEVAGVQCREQARGIRAVAAHHHPVAAPVGSRVAEVGIVGGDDLVIVTLAEQAVDVAGAVALAIGRRAGGVEDFDGRGRRHGKHVLIGQVIPRGMGGGDVGSGRLGPRRQLRPGLCRARRRKVGRQSDRQNVPRVAQTGCRSVQLGSQDGGKAGAAVGSGVGDREPVALQEVVGEADEVVAAGAIEGAHLGGSRAAVRCGGMSMQIAAVPAAGLGEGKVVHA